MPLQLLVFLGCFVFEELKSGVGPAVDLRYQLRGFILDL